MTEDEDVEYVIEVATKAGVSKTLLEDYSNAIADGDTYRSEVFRGTILEEAGERVDITAVKRATMDALS